MFLLLNRLLIIIFLFSLSLYFPYLSYYGVDLTPNFILIIMTLVGLKTDKKISTIFGFFMGLIQDLTTQYLSLGFFLKYAESSALISLNMFYTRYWYYIDICQL